MNLGEPISPLHEMGTSKSTYTTELARELLDDIELGRLSAEAIVLKALRLARLAGDEAWAEWLNLELHGYYSNSGDNADKYARSLGRVINAETKVGHWGPLAQIEASITTDRQRLQTLRVPDISLAISSANPKEYVAGIYPTPSPQVAATNAINKIVNEVRVVTLRLDQLTAIRSRAMGWIHTFAVRVYHERAFSGMAESIFERYKAEVDTLLAQRAGDVLSKIPSINDRLAEGDAEAISQALTTARRVIDAFADAVYPASNTPVEVEGKPLKVTQNMVKNRLMVYVNNRITSGSRRTKLKRALSDLYDRVSTGVHTDVTTEEARALFLEVYNFLGQVLLASPPPQAAVGTTDLGEPLASEPGQAAAQ